MRRLLGIFAAGAAYLFAQPVAAESGPGIRVVGTSFEVTRADGKVLKSAELAGAVLDIQWPDGGMGRIRIDSVTPAEERPSVLLHAFSIQDRVSGEWRPACDPDGFGRRAGFPVAGAWGEHEQYVKDPGRWFLTCSSGSQGKCVLWGYDPWSAGRNGEDLAPLYQACQFMARADYDGRGEAHTRDGTRIHMSDPVVHPDGGDNPVLVFEAGWGPHGAVCVARTRWPDLLSLEALLAAEPRLKGEPCDRAEAARRGAVLFSSLPPR